MHKLFTNREQIRLLNSKSTDLDWYYSKHFWKLKLLIGDLLFTTFMKNPPVQFLQHSQGRGANYGDKRVPKIVHPLKIHGTL